MKRACATLTGWLCAAAAAGCNRNPVVQTRTVTVYAPSTCAVGASPYALGSAPYALFQPFGDFEPPGPAAGVVLANSDVGAVLAGFPADTQEVVATISGASSSEWAAHALLAATGEIDLLALPFGSPCAFTGSIESRSRMNGALGAFDEGHALVAGGTLASGEGVPTTELIDLTRGTVGALPLGVLVPRTNPTLTAWTGGAIVAGGLQLDGSPPSFEIYASSAGDFDGATHALSQARARHGAVVMTSGETLLVGGVDPGGDVLGSMEAIDPVAQRARTGGLASLQVPRADPVVMRLASGEILVAGGIDGDGEPVATLEWFLPDGSLLERTSDLVASPTEAFTPLPAGGALAVIAPASPAPGFQNVWVISAAGVLQAATPIAGALTDPHLVPGTEEEPVLWTGDRWLTWQPWSGTFVALASAIGAPGPTADPTTSPEPGLGVWTDGATTYAFRFGTRGPYATTPATSPLLLEDTSFTAPDQLVTSAGGPVAFDPETGLTLQPGASVFVTDATFASFALDAETPGSLPPSIVLRDGAGNETTLDQTTCAVGSGSTLHVERDGDALFASVDGGALVACTAAPAAGARVSIGMRGVGSGASVVRSVVVTRT